MVTPHVVHYRDMSAPRPDLEKIERTYAGFFAEMDAGASSERIEEIVRAWDGLRRSVSTWQSLTQLRFHQDTTNAEYKAEKEHADEIAPTLTRFAIEMKRRLLASDRREAIETTFGAHAFRLWECDVTTFEPAIESDLVEESKLDARYVELLASARVDFGGETLNLPALNRFASSGDRKTRYGAAKAKWSWFADNRQALDEIFDQLVGVRNRMAIKLGYEDYVDLGYRRMQRVDYVRDDVTTFREQVIAEVVPLAKRLREEQSAALGVDRLMAWDETVHDLQGNPSPRGDGRWMTDQAKTMFAQMDPQLGSFFQMMDENGLLDLETRDGKSGGGFCTSLEDYGVPFIFANFNGTKGDVEVFTHEAGHAFQAWMSRNVDLWEYLWPTYEAAEIHSMSLEFLTWPHMDLFFGEESERFRRIHLAESLLFLPYGVAVDHFQHLVYANPSATPADRHEMWRSMEETYLPWRDYGDLPHVSEGGRWQAQRHIYGAPFYYIDYALAQTCALQFWARANADREEAMRSYVELCSRGGSAAFQELARSADLVSPFEAGCLTNVVKLARETLHA